MTEPIAAIARKVLAGWTRRYIGAGALAITILLIVTLVPSRPPSPAIDDSAPASRSVRGRVAAPTAVDASQATAPTAASASSEIATASANAPTAVDGGGPAPSSPTPAPDAPQPVTCPAPLPPAPPPQQLPVADLFGLLAPIGPVTGLFTAETLASLPLVAPLLPLVTPLVPLAAPALSAAAPVAEQLAGPAATIEQPLIAPLRGPIEEQTPSFLAYQQQFMDTVAPVLALFGDPNVAMAIACGSQAEGAVVGQVQPAG